MNSRNIILNIVEKLLLNCLLGNVILYLRLFFFILLKTYLQSIQIGTISEMSKFVEWLLTGVLPLWAVTRQLLYIFNNCSDKSYNDSTS